MTEQCSFSKNRGKGSPSASVVEKGTEGGRSILAREAMLRGGLRPKHYQEGATTSESPLIGPHHDGVFGAFKAQLKLVCEATGNE